MARPQSGLDFLPAPFTRIQIFEVPDIPMNAMSVGQFSVWLPGLASQIVKAHPGETLQVVIGFGFMFWVLAWHGKRPRNFSPFEEVDGAGGTLAEAEGDLWVYYRSSRPDLIQLLVQEMETHIKELARPVFDGTSEQASLLSAFSSSSDYRIPLEEADFANGCFVDVHAYKNGAGVSEMLEETPTCSPEGGAFENSVMGHLLPLADSQNGMHLMLLFHNNPEAPDEIAKAFLDRPDQGDGLQPGWGVRFFVPSLDVLTGLRQGGIRMNRFSPTQQWNQ